jgi:glutamine synthetase
MSVMGQQFVEGILIHLPATMAITIPTVNSFRRVGHGCWTGSDAIWAFDDKNAPIRIVIDNNNPNKSSTRLEYKLNDSTANIYLSLSAVILAGLDGIDNKLTLRNALSNMKHNGEVEKLPLTIAETLDLLEASKLMNSCIPGEIMKGYLAIRRSEAQYAQSLSLDDELCIALERA